MPTTYHADFAWRGGEAAATNVRIEVANGIISAVAENVEPRSGDEHIAGVVMPGLVNAHSHAFHRALRGRTHNGDGDFWSWRKPMYKVANALTPENYSELSAMVYAEMVLSGITGVGEFHYVHHNTDGTAYSDPNEMSFAVVRAAQRAGIRLAILDAAYLHAGFDQPEPLTEQTRFADKSIDAWLDRVDRLGDGGDGWTIGLAPHSVRAVYADELDEIVGARYGRIVHVHVSEQFEENVACLAATGKTPTGVLAEVGLLGSFATAVHATHLTNQDIKLLGSSNTTACFCPTTERDLADGVGPAVALVNAGTPLALGSDSHAVIDLFEEARAVELNERLITARRGLHRPGDLLAAATSGGAHSLGWIELAGRIGIQPGSPADFIALSLNSTRLASFRAESAAACIVYSAAPADVTDVWIGGRRIVENGSHTNIEDVVNGLRNAITQVVSI
ncbi:MAG: formimidoylglutamate deiminase [Ilumatobacteraceae bacterium]